MCCNQSMSVAHKPVKYGCLLSQRPWMRIDVLYNLLQFICNHYIHVFHQSCLLIDVVFVYCIIMIYIVRVHVVHS